MKRILISIGVLSSLLFADESVTVPLEEAVQVNTKLIQVLFDENKRLTNEINEIKEKLNKPTIANTSFVKNAPYSESSPSNMEQKSAVERATNPKAKILFKSAYVRTYPGMKSGEVIDEKQKGAIVQCDAFENNWCKLNTGGYIWGDYLKDAEPFKIITNKKAKLRTSPQVREGNVSEEIGSGIVFNAVSYNNGWYKLENNFYLSDVTTSRYCK